MISSRDWVSARPLPSGCWTFWSATPEGKEGVGDREGQLGLPSSSACWAAFFAFFDARPFLDEKMFIILLLTGLQNREDATRFVF